MKRRKNRKELQAQNESTNLDINEVQIQSFGYQQSQNFQNLNKKSANQSSLIPEQPKDNQKTCAQSLKQKLQYFWVHMINYLQFDRVLSNEEIDLLKKQNYTIKMKYPDNYHLTYPQRSKTFGISIEEITRMKMQEQQIKNKNFWNQLKRLVCCQGGNELQENDEILTAASQTEYFYLNKMKKKHKKSIEMTEQTLIEKPFSKMTRQDSIHEKQTFDKSNQMKAKSNIFYEDEQIFQDKVKDSDKQTNISKNKNIDMNNVKTIKKRNQQQGYQSNSSKKQENQINNTKKQIYNEKNLKETEKVYIHKRQNLNSNRQPLDKLNINSHQKEDEIDEVFIDSNNTNAANIYKKDLNSKNDNNKQGKQNTSEIHISGNSHQQSKKSKDQQSTNPSSLNPSYQKFTPHTGNSESHHFNFEEKSQKPNQKGNFSHQDNADMISVAQSQNKEISNNPGLKKNHKRQRSKLTKQEAFLDLVLQNPIDNQNQNNVLQQSIDDDLGKKKHYFSSQQLSKKSKKRPLNLSQFDQVINEGLEDEYNKLQRSFNQEFGNDKETLRNNNSAMQLAKKKKVRNKRIFNLQGENEKADEVIIFDQNEEYVQQERNNGNRYANTIDVSQNLTEHGSSTSNIKKRKKAKKLKDFNEQNDDYNVIVIEGDQNVQQNENQNDQNTNKFSTIGNPSLQNPFGAIKADKKRKKKTRLREEIQKQEQFQVVDLGEIN